MKAMFSQSDIPSDILNFFEPAECGECYVCRMVEVSREVWRVLRDDGTLWLNLGDSYASQGGANPHTAPSGTGNNSKTETAQPARTPPIGLKPKDLCGIPWRVAFALQADGWYLRQDIIWAKPNPMPESVTDRCTKAHEYIFLLTKKSRYYYDADAIKEPMAESSIPRMEYPRHGKNNKGNSGQYAVTSKEYSDSEKDGFRNKRSVWTVTTKPYSEAHFATFPPDLIRPCILAGCPRGGVVMDCFMGACTTALVAYKNRRNYIGCELSPDYVTLGEKHLQKEKEKSALFEDTSCIVPVPMIDLDTSTLFKD